jgi:hypothetical protein
MGASKPPVTVGRIVLISSLAFLFGGLLGTVGAGLRHRSVVGMSDELQSEAAELLQRYKEGETLTRQSRNQKG